MAHCSTLITTHILKPLKLTARVVPGWWDCPQEVTSSGRHMPNERKDVEQKIGFGFIEFISSHFSTVVS